MDMYKFEHVTLRKQKLSKIIKNCQGQLYLLRDLHTLISADFTKIHSLTLITTSDVTFTLQLRPKFLYQEMRLKGSEKSRF